MTHRPLPILAAEIQAADAAYIATQKSALEHAQHAGELLIEAKAQLQHGDWLPWLEANCHLSVRVAQMYMRIAREWPRLCGDSANTKRVSLLPIRDALTIIADELTDPDELGTGGSDDGDDDDDDDTDDDDDEDADQKMFRAFFSAAAYDEFRKQFEALKPLLRTRANTDTLVKVVQLVYSARTENRTIEDDDADYPADRAGLDTARG